MWTKMKHVNIIIPTLDGLTYNFQQDPSWGLGITTLTIDLAFLVSIVLNFSMVH